ncbi:EF-hand calcium-binding domain-containing protein 9-like [Pollicipes pollicipes]|uniref:EF-hand calcium-binding domain-containing protein 9-like n=1 Tax=Pollicipes pollicipes TaxID=41117 RepID=UPI001885340A|nr:EF-hand calcium-binding domain-containing protein 9-like [Pollicipes pollicipes]
MEVTSELLKSFHLDPSFSLLTVRSSVLCMELFNLLDIHEASAINDVIFCSWLRSCTDLSHGQLYDLFELFDVDRSGEIDFDEFYLVIAILVAVKDNVEKEFIYRHSRAVFNIMDFDQSGTVSAEEFERIGFLFNFYSTAIRSIFKEFDVSGDSELDFKEFKLFAMACIDQQRAIWLSEQRKQLHRKQLKFLSDNREMLLFHLSNRPSQAALLASPHGVETEAPTGR